MISILKLPTEQGNLPIKICPICGCTITYDEDDKNYDQINENYYISCPDCYARLQVRPPKGV